MMTEPKILAEFSGKLEKDPTSGWVHVAWKESEAVLGNGKAKKVRAVIDGHESETAIMPLGNGTHMVPVKAPIRKALKKDVGDEVVVQLFEL